MNTNTQKCSQAQKALEYFFPHTIVLNLQRFGSGHIHHTFLGQLSEGRQYILQQINTTVFKNPAIISQNIDHLYQHLIATDYPFTLAEPIRTPQGATLYKDQAGDHWRVFSFLSPTRSYDQVAHPEQAYAAANAFGIFLRYISNLDSALIKPGVPDFHNCQIRQKQFQSALENDPCDRLQQIEEEVAFLNTHNYCRQWQNCHLPKRLSHNDTKINNILFQPDGLTPAAIIDLDTVMLASPLYDFGDMVRTFTNAALEDAPADQVHLRMPIFKALCQGFAEATRDLLVAAEREALFLGALLMVQVQAQRFLNDYLNGDVYYHIHYPDHNLVRGRNQLALLKSMLAQEQEIQQVIQQHFSPPSI